MPLQTRCLWEDFHLQLPQLEQLRITRLFSTLSTLAYEFHGFSDASEKAYAASVYPVFKDLEAGYRSTLVTAKCKVASIKTVSLGRLELCGALLLSRLLKKVQLTSARQPPLSTAG